MDPQALLETLRALEVALHRPEVRSDREKLDRLLHPRFRELGRSGRIYTKADVLAELADQPQTYEIWSQDFQVEPLSEGLALLTYKTAHVEEGNLDRHTLRSSLWQSTNGAWQMRFHQGTPTEAFPKDCSEDAGRAGASPTHASMSATPDDASAIRALLR